MKILFCLVLLINFVTRSFFDDCNKRRLRSVFFNWGIICFVASKPCCFVRGDGRKRAGPFEDHHVLCPLLQLFLARVKAFSSR